MLRNWLLAPALLALCLSALAVDVNQASVAELDGVLGIGPSLSGRILQARGQREFKDWSDLMARVSGIRANKAQQLSAAGLTVAGAHYPGSR